jgi:leader peptidase (prepilin peptidase)/N-methyltransferase
METVRLVVCALVALPAGWFAAVLVDRVPDKLPLFDPPHPVRAKGVDLALYVGTVVLFVLAAIRFDDAPVLQLAGYLLLFGALLALSVIDIQLFRLPDRIVLPTLAVSIPLIVVSSVLDDRPEAIRYALVGGALYFGFLFVAHLVYPRGMGFGDVKLAAVMGLYVGWLGESDAQAVALVLWAMLIGFVSGSIVGVVLLAMRRRSAPIPFGPFLALGTVVAVLVSDGLISST